MQTYDFTLSEKAVQEDGRISGLAAAYGNVDDGGDMIISGALTKSLASMSAIPMLLYHDQRQPVGVWDAFKETAKGLEVSGRFSLGTANGREAHALTKDGALSGLSIGYRAVKERFEGAVRRLEQVKLFEVSLVAIPMNSKARITSVKELIDGGQIPTVRQFEEFLRDAGGFSRTLAAAIAGKAAQHLQGEPDGEADPLAAFWAAMAGAGIVDLTEED